MGKIFLITMAIVAILGLFVVPIFAREIEEVGETVWDTMRGVNDDCPVILTTYVAKTFKDVLFNKKADIRAEIGYEFDSHNLVDDNQVNIKVGLEF